MNEQINPEARDRQLWRIARRRASFRRQLAVYIIVNTFLWLIWAFSERPFYHSGVPWPVWPTLGWGIGIAFSWWSAYGGGTDATEKEYQRLLRERDSVKRP
jgi:hypothetical protein